MRGKRSGARDRIIGITESLIGEPKEFKAFKEMKRNQFNHRATEAQRRTEK